MSCDVSRAPEKELRETFIAQAIVDRFGEDTVVRCLDTLFSTLPKSVSKELIPHELNNPFQVEYLIDFAKNVARISSCENASGIIAQLESDFQANEFVISVGAHLMNYAELIRFEPENTATKKRADIFAQFKDQSVVFECKSPLWTWPLPFNRYCELNTLARQYLPNGHQVYFLFKEDVGDEAFLNTFKRVAELLPASESCGVIFRNDWLIVRTEQFQEHLPGGPTVLIKLALESDVPKEVYPGYAFYQDGYTLGFCGHLADRSKKIKGKLKKGAEQADKNLPFVIVINSANMDGAREKHHSVLRNEFQPKKNTRFSGALFFQSGLSAKGVVIEKAFVANPHANHPLPPQIVAALSKNTPE